MCCWDFRWANKVGDVVFTERLLNAVSGDVNLAH